MDGGDTDLLLTLLISLLRREPPSQAKLLSALADAEGDCQAAADALNREQNNKNKKRKAAGEGGSLNSWIVNKKPRSEASVATTSTSTGIGDHNRNDPIVIEDDIIPSTSAPTNTQKPAVDLMSVLKQAPSETKKPLKLLPRTLGTPYLVAEQTPCTLHPSILPPELACRLFYVMLREATTWKRNKWWLFDRVVESPHKTSFYARETDGIRGNTDWQEAAQYWYNGSPTPPPNRFPPEMEEACLIIEKAVNEEMQKRRRYPNEWPASEKHPWKANVAASNCYTGSKEGVGFHSDQLTYLGPCPTIASLSLGTTRMFRLREVVPKDEKDDRNAQTFNIPLSHNSLVIMHASCQERFKHTVPLQTIIDAFKPPFPPPSEDEMISPTTTRINITFRFYRPDFRPSSIPRCNCGVPTILRPDMKKRIQSREDLRHEDGGTYWSDVENMRYFWMCYAGAQNDGKGCSFFKPMDMEKEGRGCFGLLMQDEEEPSRTGTPKH